MDCGGYLCSLLIDCPMKASLMSSSHIVSNRLAVICHEKEGGNRSGVVVTAVTLSSIAFISCAGVILSFEV